ncbi:hypothetical protein PSEUDO8BK_30378 [Pseudomonas sp. 8BK]|nr:hypothetical protein PSEUDO8BK_30378 [Pseudomonas sp. 8BK]
MARQVSWLTVCALRHPSTFPPYGSGVSKGFGPFTVAGAARAFTLFPLSFMGMPTKNLERDKATQAMAAGQSRLTTAGRHGELRRRTHRALLDDAQPCRYSSRGHHSSGCRAWLPQRLQR